MWNLGALAVTFRRPLAIALVVALTAWFGIPAAVDYFADRAVESAISDQKEAAHEAADAIRHRLIDAVDEWMRKNPDAGYRE